MEICQRRLEGYPITYIGFSVLWARSFLQVPNINFNILQKVLVGPLGRRFIRDARKAGRSLLVWTVNEEEWMEWSIRKAVDGVITDDPKKFLDVCARHEAATGSGKGSVEGAAHRPTLEAKRRAVRRWAELYLDIIKFNVLTIIMTGVFIYHLGWPSTQVRKSLLANHAVRQAS
jgi:phosphatidylglycerol phospholipase C